MNETTVHPGEPLSGSNQRLNDLSRTAGRKVGEAQVGTAEALENAASTVRTSGRTGSEAIDNLTESAAGKLDSTAAYVRSPRLEGTLRTFRQVIRRHPTSSLILGAAIGLLAGTVLWRRARAIV